MSYQRSSVDEQVVKMSFDNSNFDSNINDSIKALNNLDERLISLNKDDFSQLTNNLESFSRFFTAKGQIMLGVLTRIGSEVVSLGLKFKNYLFKGIKDGIGEYETIINSTQTIYQNVKQSGASLQDVNNALDELNDYADKTIYNFGQMTNMIGRFSAAGVGLNKSVSTIKGLANAAALVGANTEKAQMAWNAVAKAMSKGKFDLLAWKTLEYSGIAGEQFNELIKEVARVNNVTGKSGQNIDEMIAKYGSLAYTLQEGWLDKDTFNEAMQIMSGALTKEDLLVKGYSESQIEKLLAIADAAEEAATKVKTFRQLMDTLGEAVGSGWAQSFRILIGDLEQAKDLYTRISDVISDFIDNNAKIRNKLFKQITDEKDVGLLKDGKTGRDDFRQIIENMLTIVKTFLKAVKTGFLNIFPIERISAAARKVLDVFQNFTRALVLNKGTIDENSNLITWDTTKIEKVSEAIKDLIRFCRGLASAIDIVWMTISQPIKAVVERIPFFQNFFKNTNGGLVNLLKNLGKFGDKITVIRNAIKDTNFFGEVVGYFIDNIDELGKKYPILGAILQIFSFLKNAVTNVKDAFKSLNIKPLAVLFGAIKFIAEAISKIITFVAGVLDTLKNKVDWSFLDGPKKAIVDFFKKLSDYGQGLVTFEELVGKIGEKLKDIFSKIFKIFDRSNRASNKVIDSANKVQNAGTKIGDALGAVWDKVKDAFSKVGSFFNKIFAGADFSLEGITKKLFLVGGGVAAATVGISHLMKTFAKINIMNNFNDLLVAGIDVLKAYEAQIQSKMILSIAISVGILAAAMLTLSLVPYDKLENGLIIFSSFMATLAITLTPIITALAKFNESLGKARKQLTQYDVLNTVAKKLGNAANKLARGAEFKMIGSALKDLAIAVLILVGALTALVFLFKYEEDNLIKAAKTVAKMVGVITIAVLGLVAAAEKFSNRIQDTKASVATFATFFKLAGVSGVILSLASAILILAGAMAIMTKLDPDRLNTSYAYLMSMVGLLGAIALGVTYFVSKSNEFNKFKKVSVSMFGALAGIAVVLLAMKPVIEAIQADDSYAWQKALIIFTAVIGQFTAMTIALLKVAKSIGSQENTWAKWNKTFTIMAATLAVIGGVLYVIGNMHVTKNTLGVVITLGLVIGGIISLLSLIAIVIAKAKSTFSGNFATIINRIAISIAAVIASIGVMSAGIAALISVLSSMNVPDSDLRGGATNLFNKLATVADIINKALPKLRKMFYSIGWSVGSMFMSFGVGFADSLISNGEQTNSIADRVVNIIIDLLDKVSDILYRRKDDIAKIIKKVLEFVFAEVTAVLNEFFKKKDGTGLFTEDGVAKLLGLGGVTVGAGKGLLELGKNFNTVSTSVTNLGKAFKWISTHANDATATMWNLVSHARLIDKAGNGAANALSKLTGQTIKFEQDAYIGFGKTLVVIMAVYGAIETLRASYHLLQQEAGEESAYIRSDVNDFGEALLAFFTDSQFRMQIWIEGIRKIRDAVAANIESMKLAIQGIIEFIKGAVMLLANFILEIWFNIAKIFSPNKMMDDYFDDLISEIQPNYKKYEEAMAEPWHKIGEVWSEWKNDKPYQDFIDGTYSDFYSAGEDAASGMTDGINSNIVNVNDAITEMTQGAVDTARSILDEHSPSKVFEEIYRNVMYGSINGLKSGEESFYNYMRHISDTAKGIAAEDAGAIASAWSDIIKAQGLDSAISIAGAVGDSDAYTGMLNQKWGLSAGDNIRKSYATVSKGDQEKEIKLNEQLLNLTIKRSKEIEKLYEQYGAYGTQQQILAMAEQAGIEATEEDVLSLVVALQAANGQLGENIEFTQEWFKNLDEFTAASVADAISKEQQATDLAMANIANNYAEMQAIAEDHKDEIIGLKQEEVQEVLREEAIQRGMSQQAAEDYSRIVTENLFEGVEERKALSADEYAANIALMRGDLENYYKYQEAKTNLEQEGAKLRAELEKNPYNEVNLKMQQGYYKDVSSMLAATKEVNADLRAEWGKTKTAYDKLYREFDIAQRKALYGDDKSSGLLSGAERAGMDVAAYAQSQVDAAMNLIGKQASNKRGTFKDIFTSLFSGFGASLGDVDLSWWNIGDDKNESSILPDSEVSNAIDAASDLKDGLESQRADLTPTFDLDQLASDANKATGIVMSSLMAAQNASIGDYINKDSELNPFMKDRWQNVYNFTQNNYSPKALSRIDIYRQTQRQLSMTRGF